MLKRCLLLALIAVLAGVVSPVFAGPPVEVAFLDGFDALKVVHRDVVGQPIETAVAAMAAGPTAEEAALGLYSRVPPSTKLAKVDTASGLVVLEFGPEVLEGLDEGSLLLLYGQVRAGLNQFDWVKTIRLESGGKLLSSYLDPSVPVGEPAKPLQKAEAGTAGLGGRNITLGPSHGRFWNGSGWYWQRSDPCGFGEAVLEDTNSIRLIQFLYQYLAQDGATVHVARELNESNCCNGYEGQAWWRMAAYSWLRANGLPTSVWANSTGVGGEETATGRVNDDIRARPKFADYRGSDIYIAHHTNAGGGGTARGTETYRDTAMENPAHETNSLNLANAVQNNVISAIRDMYDSGWVTRGVKDSAGGFGEIRIPNRPAILIELAFHDGCNSPSTDAYALRDNYFRSVAEWGLYKGICEYFGSSPTWDKYSCEYVSDTIPATMEQGKTYNVSVTFRNRGVLWVTSRGFRLGANGDSDPFTGSTRFDISGEVRPGNTYTWNFQLTAGAPGVYTSDWRMVRDGVAWFGPILSKTVTVQTGDTEAPTQPTGLNAVATQPDQVQLTWTASTDNEGVTGYQVRRNGSVIGTSASASYTDNSAQPNNSYTYDVRAYDASSNYSAWSDPDSASTPADVTAPSVPAGLTLSMTPEGKVHLVWSASTDDVAVTGYEIRRNGSALTTVTGTSYDDATVEGGGTYVYAIRAKDAVPNYSAWSEDKSITTPVTPSVVFSDGFDSLGNWVQTAGKEFALVNTQNHGSFAGVNAAYCAAGESDQMYHAFARPFAQGKVSGYFYDSKGGYKTGVCGNAYRQALSLREISGAATFIVDNCFASNVGNANYYYRKLGGGGSSTYTSYGTRNPATACNGVWVFFETQITPAAIGASPTGTITLKVNDGTGDQTLNTDLTTDFFSIGAGRITLGLGVSSAAESWWDDIQFIASAPNMPTMGAATAVSSSSIQWTFGAGDANLFGFDVLDAGGAAVSPAYPASGWLNRSATSWTEGGLTPNTAYTRKVRAWNGTLNSAASSTVTRWTLAAPASASTISCDKNAGVWYSTPQFNFTAVGGFGAGKVANYTYAWTQSASYAFTGSEPVWSAGQLSRTAAASGSWYLHLKAFNGEGAGSAPATFGPYQYDADAPGAPTVTDEGQWTPSLTTLKATWTAASDGSGSGVASYEYAVGTSASTQDILGWTSAGAATSAEISSLSLTEGQQYFIQVRATDNAALTGPAGASDGITPAPAVDPIGLAWALSDGTGLAIKGKIVTAVSTGAFWIQEIDRSAGVKVASDDVIAIGDKVSVAGTLGMSGTQRVLLGDVVLVDQSGQTVPAPLFMTQRVLGGQDFNPMTPGVTDAVGLYNLGLLVSVWGNVTYADSTDPAAQFFYVDDGSGWDDGSGHPGVKVMCGSITPPAGGTVMATGVVNSASAGSKVVPVVSVRQAGDILPL